MMRFLRFEVGGASALFWMLLFLTPHLNIDALTQVDAMKLFAVIFGSITLSIPLGNYVHQFTDAVFNPFARRRLILWPRAVIRYIEGELGQATRFHDGLYQAVLVFSKSHARTSKIANAKIAKPKPGRTQELNIDFKVEILREEIANRYSYYYARIENGVVSPVFGYLLALLLIKMFGDTRYITLYPAFSPWWMVSVAIAGAIPVLWRIPQLFRELDDLEVALVALQRDNWPTGTLGA
jgi:hypothetical protein